MDTLRGLWHKRLRQMHMAGWPKIADPRQWQYMRNCPPFGGDFTDTSRRCDVKLYCPFCWARRFVLHPFMSLEKALYGGFSRNPPCNLILPYPDLTLVEFTRTYVLKPHTGIEWTSDIKRAMIEHARRIITGPDRRDEISLFEPLGGVVLHRVLMCKKAYRLKRSGILICRMPADYRVPEWVADLKAQNRFSGNRWPRNQIRKALLKVAFSRRFSYPKLLFDAKPDDVFNYLHGLRGVRMLSTFGICRPSKSQNCFGDSNENEADHP